VVVIREPRNGYPSGGKMAGSVFKDVAEKTMALKSIRTPEYLTNDTIHKAQFLPFAKNGRADQLQKVLTTMGLPYSGNSAQWVKADVTEHDVKTEKMSFIPNKVPDLKGMGAKDALFMLGELGLKVRINGRGKVTAQDRLPGSGFRKGDLIILTLN
jgi:cell division protein FtsI (penicillin-binding protein 3)